MNGWTLAIAVIGVAAIASAFDSGPDESPCERDYRTVYVHRHTPYDIGVDQYCANVNGGPIDPYGLHDSP